MKVLIIGGSGNISLALTRILHSRGCELTLYKRTTLLPDELGDVRIIVGDRTDAAGFRKNLASCGPFDSVVDMVCYEPTEAEADVEVFRDRTKQLIFCSTVDVYTKTPRSYPVSEENGEIGVAASFPYAFKKMQCEEIFWDAHRRGDFALTVFRPAFTYNETWSPAIHSFGGQTYHIDRIRRAMPILMHGDGMTISVATHRDDVAIAFANAVAQPVANGNAYNVTGDEWMTQNYIWETVASILGAPRPDFVYIPTDHLASLAPKEAEWCLENFRYNVIFDSSRAKRDLGFRYNISYQQGAERSLNYLLQHDRIDNADGYPFYDKIVEIWRENSTRSVSAMCEWESW